MKKMKKTKIEKKKTRVTVTIDRQLIKRIRTAVAATKVTSFAALVEFGMKVGLSQLEKLKGEAFKPKDTQLKVGRPKKATSPNIWETLQWKVTKKQ